MDDLSILEMDLGQRAADLGPQLDAIDRRKLAEEADPRVDIAQQRLAHCHGAQAASAPRQRFGRHCDRRRRTRRRPRSLLTARPSTQGHALDLVVVVVVSFRASTSDQLLISFMWMPR